jgi:hypothetical protein
MILFELTIMAQPVNVMQYLLKDLSSDPLHYQWIDPYFKQKMDRSESPYHPKININFSLVHLLLTSPSVLDYV